MYASVRQFFPVFSQRFEGRIPWMYLDIKGLVTVGIGNLIDPIALALELPFRSRVTRAPASKDDIAAEWLAVKATTSLARKGASAAERIAKLELSAAAIDELVGRKLNEFYEIIKTKYFPEFDSYPADAQLAILSMAWAMGPYFPRTWPTFSRNVKDQNWVKAGNGCQMKEAGNPGVVARNAANKKLFFNAAVVKDRGSDPSVLLGATAHEKG